MSRWQRFRHRINRDDGRLYQAGNHDLGAMRVAGLGLLVAAMAFDVFHQKVGMDPTRLGWMLLPSSAGCLGWAGRGGAGKA